MRHLSIDWYTCTSTNWPLLLPVHWHIILFMIDKSIEGKQVLLKEHISMSKYLPGEVGVAVRHALDLVPHHGCVLL